MQRRSALLVAWLVAAGPALAGTAEDPEITDAAGDTDPPPATWGDILSVFFNETATDIVATMTAGDMSATPPLTAWYVLADAGGETFGWGCSTDQGGAVSCFYSHWDRAVGPTDFNAGTGSASGGTVTMNLPKQFAPNATAGTALSRLEAGTGQLTPLLLVPFPAPLPLPGQLFFHQVDTATASRDYVMAGGVAGAPGGPTTQGPGAGNATGNGIGGNETTPPAGPPPAPTPGVELPLVAAAAAAVARVARRKR